MNSVLASVTIGIFCGLILNIFYVVVKHEWPSNYFGLGGSVDPIISRNIFRYSIFRFAPSTIATLAAAITTERIGGTAYWAVAAVLSVHLARVLSVIVRDLINGRRAKAAGTTLIAVFVASFAIAAAALRSYFTQLIPAPSELVANMWAGLLAAIGAVYLQKISMVRKDPKSIATKSLATIPEELVRYAIVRSIRIGIAPKLVIAVMVTENMQRPGWFRRLERWILRGKGRRTLFIMQQECATSDKHSIDLAIERYFQPHLPMPSGNWERYDWCRDRINDYNSGSQFRDLAGSILHALWHGNKEDGLKSTFKRIAKQARREIRLNRSES